MLNVEEQTEAELAEFIGTFYDDPLGFVLAAYPWGEEGSLKEHAGPDTWQRECLEQIGEQVKARKFDGVTAVGPIRIAVSSGHGIGKSVLVAWLVDWIMSTRPNAQGTITANTITQLDTKTWAAIQRWTKLCLTSHWFSVNSERMYRVGSKESWFCAKQSSKEENSEAFAGQHAADSTSFYIFDEASAIPDPIYEVAEGGLTDGEPMVFLFGNPTRNTGNFHKACFGSMQHRWHPIIVDSRTSRFTNKTQIQEWLDDYGEDSDFFRVRVTGRPPNASDAQFIDSMRIWQAQKNTPMVMPQDPLIAGVDVSGGGSAWTVCRFRRGLDARSLAPIRLTGEQTMKDDRQLVVSMLAERLQQTGPNKITAMFVDSAFGSPIVVHLRNRGFENVYEVNFGGASPDPHQANQRAYQWNKLKEWLPRGSIDKHDARLESDMAGPGFHLNKKNQLVLEPKESMIARGLASPDDGDALSLTFAQPVIKVEDDDAPPYRPVSAYG